MNQMERKEAMIKIEDPGQSMSFYDHFLGSYSLASVMDLSMEAENSSSLSSLGFMELLGAQDFGFGHSSSSSLFDMVHVPWATTKPQSLEHPTRESQATTLPETSSEVLNTPATPNSASVSSASNEEHHRQPKDTEEEQDEEEQQHKNKTTQQQLKPKKGYQKKQREPRFAFMTQSEVDHLEDGYRWRKYGQKAVKNSPFPRSYYRCTSASCNVKKRVERSFNNPSIVVTTYEGQHTHPNPVMLRPTSTVLPPGSGTPASNDVLPMQMPHLPRHHPHFTNLVPALNCGGRDMSSAGHPTSASYGSRFCTPAAALMMRDQGLLQDVFPSIVTKEES